jgi:hypothetical protein
LLHANSCTQTESLIINSVPFITTDLVQNVSAMAGGTNGINQHFRQRADLRLIIYGQTAVFQNQNAIVTGIYTVTH